MTRFGRFATLIALLCAVILFPSAFADRAAAQTSGWQSAEARENPFREESSAEWAPSRAQLTDASTEPTTLPPSARSLASVRPTPAWSDPSTTTRTTSSVNRQPRAQQQRNEANRPQQRDFIPPRSMDQPELHTDRQAQPVAQQRRPHRPQSAAAKDANSRWLLPNQKPAHAASHNAPAQQRTKVTSPRTNAGSRPMANQSPREPREFVPPASAAQLNAGRPSRQSHMAPATTDDARGTQNPASTGAKSTRATAPNRSLYHGSAAIAPAAAVAATTATNPRPTNRARLHSPPQNTAHMSQRDRASQGLFTNGRQNGSYANRIYNSITVAFEGPEAWTAFEEGEELPMPGRKISQGDSEIVGPVEHVPMLQEEGGYEVVEGPVFSDGYGGSSDGMCYGEAGYGCADGACGCGGACEPGCGCDPSCGCGNCGSKDLLCIGCGDDDSCHTVRLRIPKWQELMIFGGVQGFKGPYDQARDSGNFGFHEGFNAGFKVPYTSMGYQIGFQSVQSQLSGDKDTDIADPHTQHFFTAGMFQRTKHGFQGGAVYDVLRDERWGAVDFHQMRAEISYIDRGCHEFGFAGAFHLNEHEAETQDDDGTTIWRATDQYLLFYRFHGKRGGEGRFYAGVNDDSDGIIGSDMMLPLTDRWSLQPGFTYLIPDEDGGEVGAAQEAWNIGIAMVWHWDCRARKCYSSCYRPLFNVANNGYLIVDDRSGAAP